MIEWMLFSNILTSQPCFLSHCAPSGCQAWGKRTDCLMDNTSCSSLTSSSLSLPRLSGMHSQHWRSGPGLLSFFCSSCFLWSCSLTLHDEFSIGEPLLTSLHIILFPWHTVLCLVSLTLRLISHFPLLRCSNLFSSFLYLKYVKYIFYIVEHVF